jgi:hypothetical protein
LRLLEGIDFIRRGALPTVPDEKVVTNSSPKLANLPSFGWRENRKSKAGKGFYVIDLKIDTDEVDGSSPFGSTISAQEIGNRV